MPCRACSAALDRARSEPTCVTRRPSRSACRQHSAIRPCRVRCSIEDRARIPVPSHGGTSGDIAAGVRPGHGAGELQRLIVGVACVVCSSSGGPRPGRRAGREGGGFVRLGPETECRDVVQIAPDHASGTPAGGALGVRGPVAERVRCRFWTRSQSLAAARRSPLWGVNDVAAVGDGSGEVGPNVFGAVAHLGEAPLGCAAAVHGVALVVVAEGEERFSPDRPVPFAPEGLVDEAAAHERPAHPVQLREPPGGMDGHAPRWTAAAAERRGRDVPDSAEVGPGGGGVVGHEIIPEVRRPVRHRCERPTRHGGLRRATERRCRGHRGDAAAPEPRRRSEAPAMP